MPRRSRDQVPITDPHRLLPRPSREPSLSHMKMSELVTLATDKARTLATREMDLIRADAEIDLRQEAKTVAGLGIGGVAGLLTMFLLLVAVVFALTETGLPGWAASLILAAVVLLAGTISAIVGWRVRVRDPMAASRRSLREGVAWAKDLP